MIAAPGKPYVGLHCLTSRAAAACNSPGASARGRVPLRQSEPCRGGINQDRKRNSPAKAGAGIKRERDPRVTLAALAHPGLNSVAAPRLIEDDEADVNYPRSNDLI